MSEFKDSRETATANNSICFNPDNTLKQVFARTAAASFSDYRPFGSKLIARSITVWHGETEIKVSVTLLEPLSSDEGHFLLNEDTGYGSRLRFVTVNETDLRDFKVNTPPPVWPTIHNFPDSGVMTVNVRIGRDGKIHEIGDAISINNAVVGAALDQIKTWTFRPYLVDGFPVQVNTNLVIPFQARVELLGTGGATYAAEPALQRIKKARELSDLRIDGSMPFHLRASLEVSGSAAGSYEEIWQSPTKWRREAKLPGLAVIESRNDNHLYRKVSGSGSFSDAIDEFLAGLDGNLPNAENSFHEGDWRQSIVQLDNQDTIRIARGYESPEGKLDENSVACWFDVSGVLRAQYSGSKTTTYDDFLEWYGKRVPRRTETTMDGALVLRTTIEGIEPAVAENSIFTIEAADPRPAAAYSRPSKCGIGSL